MCLAMVLGTENAAVNQKKTKSRPSYTSYSSVMGGRVQNKL